VGFVINWSAFRVSVNTTALAPDESDGSPTLRRWLYSPSAATLDPVTRQYLIFVYAVEAASRGHLSSQQLSQLSVHTQTADVGGLLTHLPVQPEYNGAVLAALRLACLQVGYEQAVTLRGRFISLEGGDGSGKTTLAKMLAEQLGGISTRALGGAGGASLELRALILQPEFTWQPLAELLLTAAIYRETLTKVIVPALQRGQTVVSDRWCDTLAVYLPNHAAGVDAAQAMEAYRILTADLAPDLAPDITFILNLPFTQALARRTQRPLEASKLDRNEAKGDEFHERVFSSYHALIGTAPRFVGVDADKPLGGVLECMLQQLEQQKELA
jgi:dTMP kinase